MRYLLFVYLHVSILISVLFRKSLSSNHVAVHVNLMVAIFLADIVFLAGSNRTHNKVYCLYFLMLISDEESHRELPDSHNRYDKLQDLQDLHKIVL